MRLSSDGTPYTFNLFEVFNRVSVLKQYKRNEDVIRGVDVYQLRDFILDEGVSVYTKQKAIIELVLKLQKNPGAIELCELRKLFELVPFNRTFLKKLYKNRLIKFALIKRLKGKYGRDIFEACKIYSNKGCKFLTHSSNFNNDGEVIDEVFGNCFENIPDIYNSSIVDFKKYLFVEKRSFFTKIFGRIKKIFVVYDDGEQNKQNKEKEEREIEQVLKKCRSGNVKFYQQLLNKVFIFHMINRTELPRELSAKVVGFVDARTARGIVKCRSR